MTIFIHGPVDKDKISVPVLITVMVSMSSHQNLRLQPRLQQPPRLSGTVLVFVNVIRGCGAILMDIVSSVMSVLVNVVKMKNINVQFVQVSDLYLASI